MASSRRDEKGERGSNQTKSTPTVNNVRTGTVTTVTRERQASSPGTLTAPSNRQVETPSPSSWGGVNENRDGVAQSLVSSSGDSRQNVGGLYTDNSSIRSEVPSVVRPPAPDVVTAVTPPVVGPGVVQPAKTKWRSPAFLTLDVPDGRKTDVKRNTDVTRPIKERSDLKPREDVKKMVCKARPSDNKPRDDKPRGGGGGGAPLPLQKKKFVPWC